MTESANRLAIGAFETWEPALRAFVGCAHAGVSSARVIFIAAGLASQLISAFCCALRIDQQQKAEATINGRPSPAFALAALDGTDSPQ